MTGLCLSTDPGSCPGFALPFCAPDGAHEPHGCANVAFLVNEANTWPRWSCASCAADDLDWYHAFPTVCEESFGPQPCEGEGGAFSPCSYPPLRPEDEAYLRANATARPAYWNRDVTRLEMFATIDAARRERDDLRRLVRAFKVAEDAYFEAEGNVAILGADKAMCAAKADLFAALPAEGAGDG